MRRILAKLLNVFSSRALFRSRLKSSNRLALKRVIFESLEARRVLTGTAQLVENAYASGGINTATFGSNPERFAVVGSTVYFSAAQSGVDNELWRINSSGNAELVEDSIPGGGIFPGTGGSFPLSMTNVNGTLYFVASDGVEGAEVWRVNDLGIAEIVESETGPGIRPGIAGSYPMSLTNMNGTLYFSANDGQRGIELWRVNSAGSAEIVEDAVEGEGINNSGSAYPSSIVNVNGVIYFSAFDSLSGLELWRIGDSGLAEMVEDGPADGGINAGYYGAGVEELTNVNGTLYFRADDGISSYELWRVNDAGLAEMVEVEFGNGGINPYGRSFPQFLNNVNGTLFFTADDGVNGVELWRVNSAGLAEMIEDSLPGGGIGPESSSSYVYALTNLDGILYFSANDGTNGQELWKVGATGTASMIDSTGGTGINPAGSAYPRTLTNVNGTLYFSASDGVNGYELWRINSAGLAEQVDAALPGQGIRPGDQNSYPSSLTNADGTLYFVANDGTNGIELWRINSAGTAVMVSGGSSGGINPESDSAPSYLNVANGVLYFSADNGIDGRELWRVNSAGVATQVERATPGGGINQVAIGSYPNDLLNVSGTLYFSARSSVLGTELWRLNSAGIAEIVEDSIPGGGIAPGSANSNPNAFINVSGTLYFTANDAVNGIELWRVNSAGVAEMVDDETNDGGIHPGRANTFLYSLTNVSGVLYFLTGRSDVGYELWRVNSAGRAEVVNASEGGISPGSGSSYISQLWNGNGTLYFDANDGENGKELWRVNSAGRGELVEDSVPGGGINPGSGASDPRYLTEVNGVVYFNANAGNNDFELWRIGSSGVAEIVEDSIPGGGINPSVGSFPNRLTNVSGKLYFTASGGGSGLELWRVNQNGVAELVRDINPGPANSYPRQITNVNGTVYFRANDGTNGHELWRINSAGSAELVEDGQPGGGIANGSQGSYPYYLNNINGTLYFSAFDVVNGQELWRVNSAGFAEIVEGVGINHGSSGSIPREMTNIGGTLFFVATDSDLGRELWRVNEFGVAEIIEDSLPGGGINPTEGSNPRRLTEFNGGVYFVANDGVNGSELWRYPGLINLPINGDDGGPPNDTITIDVLNGSGLVRVLVNGKPVPQSNNGLLDLAALCVLQLQVTAGAGNDVLIIRGTNGNDVYTVTSNSIKLDGGYTLQIIADASIERRVIQSGNGNDSLTVQSGTVQWSAGGGIDVLKGPNTSNVWNLTEQGSGTLNGAAFSSVESVVGGTGMDSFTIDEDEALLGSLDGGAGNDTLILTEDDAIVNLAAQSVTGVGGGWKNIEKFAADEGTIIGPNTVAAWTIGGNDAFRVAYSVGSVPRSVELSGFSGIVGGISNDTYAIDPNGEIEFIEDAGGVDSISYANRTTRVEVEISSLSPFEGSATDVECFSGIESVVGSAGNDTLTGPSVGTSNIAWVIDQNAGGTVGSSFRFDSFENVIGGTQSDTFTFSANGRLNSVAGGGGSSQDKIVGPTNTNSITDWLINSVGGGSLNGFSSFVGIENVSGGAGADRFEIANAGRLTGLLDAGGGENILSYASLNSAVSVNFSISNPTATNLSAVLDKFSVVIGGAGNDTLKGSNSRGMVLVGGTGNDSITGGALSDILIGGLGSDVLYGNGGQDVVIGGRLSFDNDIVGLLNIQAVWRGSGDYNARVNQLATSNGIYSLSNGGNGLADSLLDDAAVDRVYGGNGSSDNALDWLVAATNDLTPDWDGNLSSNPIERRTRP